MPVEIGLLVLDLSFVRFKKFGSFFVNFVRLIRSGDFAVVLVCMYICMYVCMYADLCTQG